MKNDNKPIAIIPLRSGSKRIPNKNIKLLNGKPLGSYVLESALKSNIFKEIIVSTDKKEIYDTVYNGLSEYVENDCKKQY